MRNFDEVFGRSQDFLLLPSDSLQRLLNDDLLQVRSEINVFMSIVKWIQNRSQMLDALIRYVRLGLLNNQDFNYVKVR